MGRINLNVTKFPISVDIIGWNYYHVHPHYSSGTVLAAGIPRIVFLFWGW